MKFALILAALVAVAAAAPTPPPTGVESEKKLGHVGEHEQIPEHPVHHGHKKLGHVGEHEQAPEQPVHHGHKKLGHMGEHEQRSSPGHSEKKFGHIGEHEQHGEQLHKSLHSDDKQQPMQSKISPVRDEQKLKSKRSTEDGDLTPAEAITFGVGFGKPGFYGGYGPGFGGPGFGYGGYGPGFGPGYGYGGYGGPGFYRGDDDDYYKDSFKKFRKFDWD